MRAGLGKEMLQQPLCRSVGSLSPRATPAVLGPALSACFSGKKTQAQAAGTAPSQPCAPHSPSRRLPTCSRGGFGIACSQPSRSPCPRAPQRAAAFGGLAGFFLEPRRFDNPTPRNERAGKRKGLPIRVRHPSDNARAPSFSPSPSGASSPPPPAAKPGLPEITLLVLAPPKPACLLGSFLLLYVKTPLAHLLPAPAGSFLPNPALRKK